MSRADDEIERAILAPAHTFLLAGHEAARGQVLQAMASGRAHHAWLLSGPKGVGKATLAWHLARLLLAFPGAAIADAPPQGLDASHPVSRKLAALAHPDFFLLRRSRDPKTNRLRAQIAVDDVRKLGHFLAMKPVQATRRVVIVDAADEMNLNAANALLKSLEEPPEDTFFFLVSHAPGKLLPTIRSRCLHLPLQPLAEQELRQIIEQLGAEDVPPARLEQALKLAGGSPGRALQLATSPAVEHFQAIAPLLQAGQLRQLRPLLASAARAVAPASARADFTRFMELLRDWLRQQARQAAIAGQVARAARLAELHQQATRALAELESLNLDRRQLLELMVLRAAQAAAQAS